MPKQYTHYRSEYYYPSYIVISPYSGFHTFHCWTAEENERRAIRFMREEWAQHNDGNVKYEERKQA